MCGSFLDRVLLGDAFIYVSLNQPSFGKDMERLKTGTEDFWCFGVIVCVFSLVMLFGWCYSIFRFEYVRRLHVFGLFR